VKSGIAALAVSAAVVAMISAQSAPPPDIEYRDAASRLITAAMADNGGYDKLAYLTTQIGNRLSGSTGLERAIAWVTDQMKKDGLENVRTQPVKVPHWLRGRESAEIVSPVQRPLLMLGLGGSVSTPSGGVTAPVVVVSSFDELDALGPDRVKDRIVVYDEPWRGYDQTSTYRTSGGARAAKLGAVAALVRSITPRSLYTPHTGSGSSGYDASTPRIPTAAITVEDAAWIHRLTASGQEVRVHLEMNAQTLPDADSANVLGELVGREQPNEVVVVGGHLDSWDVGQGAHDDGGGIVAAWQAVVLLKQLGLKPRRTVRVVAWTNEENGSRGASAYRESLGADVGRHVAAIEMDEGSEKPVGFGFSMTGRTAADPRVAAGAATLNQIARLLAPLGADRIDPNGSETDISPLMRAGVPGLALHTVGEHYFDWHHTNADTFDKIDLQDFRRCVAALAVMAYVLADMPGRL
jgi:Iap family predicted aminopeptidase